MVEHAITIEYVTLDRLKPYEGNPRKIDESEMKKLRRSITDFGFVDPVIVRKSDNMVIGGHQRIDAAKQEGITEIPVVYVEYDDAKASMLNVALNKISGEWDWPKLGDLFEGFDTGEAVRLIVERVEAAETELTEIPRGLLAVPAPVTPS